MSKKTIKCLISGIIFVALATSCGSLVNLVGSSGATSTPTNSSETNVQAAVTSAVDEMNNTAGSSASAASAAITNLISPATLSYATVLKRFQCESEDQSSEVFSCFDTGTTAGSMSRTGTLTECALTNAHYSDAEVTGSFTNTVTHGGEGFCGSGDYILFGKMVMGRDGSNAVHTHITGDDGMVRTYTNNKGNLVTITRTASRTTSFSDPVDTEGDGIAVTVTESNDELLVTLTRTIDDIEVHNITVQTMDGSFEAKDENGDAITVAVTKPVAEITVSSTGTYRYSERTITSGNKIVDHNLANIRVVFSVGDDGLTHVAGTCDPYSGTLTYTAHEIEDSGAIGREIGTGQITYTNGSATATYEGTSINVHTRPCH